MVWTTKDTYFANNEENRNYGCVGNHDIIVCSVSKKGGAGRLVFSCSTYMITRLLNFTKLRLLLYMGAALRMCQLFEAYVLLCSIGPVIFTLEKKQSREIIWKYFGLNETLALPSRSLQLMESTFLMEGSTILTVLQ